MVQGHTGINLAERDIDGVDSFAQQVITGLQQGNGFSHAAFAGDQQVFMKIILSVGFGEELYQRDILLLIILVQDIDLRVLDGGEQFAPDLVQCVVSALLILMFMVEPQAGHQILRRVDRRQILFVPAAKESLQLRQGDALCDLTRKGCDAIRTFIDS